MNGEAMSIVLEKARELAEAISLCDELADLRDAAEKVEGDEAATQMIERLKEKQEVVRRAASSGLELPEEQISELKNLQGEIGDIASVKEFNMAQGNFNNLMEQVNNIIATALSGDSGEDPESGGCGHSDCGCG
jgi:cell fate (sporulation/competence/biofilm development) regulator YlbF (YheA/YmcA/DUF963 family)